MNYYRSSFYEYAISGLFFLVGIGLMGEIESMKWLYFMTLAGLILAYAIFKQKQAPALVIDEKGVTIRAYWFSAPISLSWENLGEIHYDIVQGSRFHTIRRLEFLGKQGEFLADIRLSSLKAADFNEIYQYIGPLAPHIVWEFPK
ncbi:TPA: hypothetical protein ACGOVN_001689 [Streptococcus suis]